MVPFKALWTICDALGRSGPLWDHLGPIWDHLGPSGTTAFFSYRGSAKNVYRCLNGGLPHLGHAETTLSRVREKKVYRDLIVCSFSVPAPRTRRNDLIDGPRKKSLSLPYRGSIFVFFAVSIVMERFQMGFVIMDGIYGF